MQRLIMKALPGNVRHFFSMPSINSLKNIERQDSTISVSMLRLDEIHPVISGNKIFKLVYFLREALKTHRKIITFGGPYSNHLSATAWAGRLCGLDVTGIVRGERPAQLSETLRFCEKNGMKLTFIPRSHYREIASLPSVHKLTERFGKHTLIPEGGGSETGAEGASLINDLVPKNVYSHLCVSVGTATTLAGLLKGKEKKCHIIGFPAVRGLTDIPERLRKCGVADTAGFSLEEAYHFGGFGKKTPQLIDFMNFFYEKQKIPLDVVYTAKMMFGVYDLIQQKKLPAGSRILCLHTGGLQGNSGITGLLSQPEPGMMPF